MEWLKAPLRPLWHGFEEWRTLPPLAKAQRRADRQPLGDDPGNRAAIDACLAWIAAAQDSSPDADGGVARHFSLISGWGRSYPETTGYIVPTLLEQARRLGRPDLRDRARRMLDWLTGIQFPEGGFQGGTIGQTPVVPVTFNTGQILLGLAAGHAEFGAPYATAMTKAADWLMNSLDADGCWRKHPTPFAVFSEKAYETHVAWGLYEAAKAADRPDWRAAALRQNRWAMTQQHPNGWVAKCCLSENEHPLTHTLGYCLKGWVEGHRHTGAGDVLDAAVRLADGLLGAFGADDRLPGRLNADWSAGASWVCLTGQVQVAWSWFYLAQVTGDARYADAARRANRFVRRTIAVTGEPHLRGAVRGSYPIDGGYGRFEYLNWAAKFAIDAFQAEETGI